MKGILSIIILGVFAPFVQGQDFAAELAGTYVGMYQSKQEAIKGAELVITRIDSTHVSGIAANGSLSFEAEVEEWVTGSIYHIRINIPADDIKYNGTFSPTTGKISVVYNNSGDARNIQSFVGERVVESPAKNKKKKD
ncbi:MAG: hypothetical protein ACI8ZN_002663 [Bacteroidia bacterium]|jgi:hypothetical protein